MNRTARTPIDLPVVGRSALIGLALLALFAFAAGAPQLVELARWAGVPRGVAWLTPVVVDGALVAYSVAAAVMRSRQQPARLMWCALLGFTGLSVAAQVVHALAAGSAPTTPALWVSVALAASLPLAVLVGVEAVISVAVSAPMPKQRRRVAKSPEDVRPDDERKRVRPEQQEHAAPKQPPKLRSVATSADRDARIVELTEAGHSSREVARLLADEGMACSPSTVTRVLNRQQAAA
ncbi:DUF2637 domain-containing protein [uncultured Tessaracoccus sp.]|uniref:DUF2637 domain-containing protein n=1 Tax=uncultured Tessaracoccus sp. TaxID=905023 RepID=UPI002613EEFD|nr:DUF2637 domain-containing protein [uncultured Tessaracoccus sp.]